MHCVCVCVCNTANFSNFLSHSCKFGNIIIWVYPYIERNAEYTEHGWADTWSLMLFYFCSESIDIARVCNVADVMCNVKADCCVTHNNSDNANPIPTCSILILGLLLWTKICPIAVMWNERFEKSYSKALVILELVAEVLVPKCW